MRIVAARDFRYILCQASCFTPDLELNVSLTMRKLVPEWLEKYDADPVTIPHAEGMPKEVPRIILKSSDGSFRCEVSPDRLNVFWGRKSAGEDDPRIAQFLADAAAVFKEYRKFFRARVGRLASVVNRYAAHESPGIMLAEHFCRPEWRKQPLNRPEHFELHAHKKFPLGGKYIVNSWVRCKTSRITEGSDEKGCVLAEQDLNTLREELPTRDYDPKQIDEFFQLAGTELDIILAFYFPGRQENE